MRKKARPLAYNKRHYDAPYFVCPDCSTKQTLNPKWEGQTGKFKCKGCRTVFELARLDEVEENLWEVQVRRP